MCPGRAVIDRFPDIRLKRRHAFAAGEVAQVHGVRLVRCETVVAAPWIGGGDLLPGCPVLDRRIRQRAPTRRRIIELASRVSDNRGLAAEGAYVREGVRRWSGCERLATGDG